MQEKKIKRITIRLSLDDYQYLKKYYLWSQEIQKYNGSYNKHKSFSDYIRYLLDLGLNDYH